MSQETLIIVLCLSVISIPWSISQKNHEVAVAGIVAGILVMFVTAVALAYRALGGL